MQNLLDDNDHVFEKMCYDEKGENICKAIEPRQKVHVEIEIIDMQDSDAIRDAIMKLGYVRTFFGLTPDQRIKMEFEKRK